MNSCVIELPYPPSANAMYRAVGGRVLMSEQGRRYVTAMQIVVTRYRRNNPIEGVMPASFGSARLEVLFEVYPPDNKKRDLGNLDKALCDSLTKAGVWDDDSQIDDLRFLRIKGHPFVNGGMIIANISVITSP